MGTLILLSRLTFPLRAQEKATGAATEAPIRVKVVVVSMFEVGEDTGDTSGEYQLWVERVGDKVVRDIVEHWTERESNVPSALK